MTALRGSLRIVEASLVGYRRTWRGTVISSFLNPIMFLAAMGMGLGSLVDSGRGDLGTPYLTFIATGLMAASAMQMGSGEGLWPVMAGLKWRKNYHAAVVTPLDSMDIVLGRAMWTMLRLIGVLVVFAIIATLFDAIDLGPALLAVFPGALTGVAFMTVFTAFTVTRETDESMAQAFRFIVIPLFLFSGTFFPISQLPAALERLAYFTPLFHGVELVRKIALPDLDQSAVTTLPIWVHLAYLLAMTALGIYFGARWMERRLKP